MADMSPAQRQSRRDERTISGHVGEDPVPTPSTKRICWRGSGENCQTQKSACCIPASCSQAIPRRWVGSPPHLCFCAETLSVAHCMNLPPSTLPARCHSREKAPVWTAYCTPKLSKHHGRLSLGSLVAARHEWELWKASCAPSPSQHIHTAAPFAPRFHRRIEKVKRV